ncbi:N-acetylgalactosamine kinase [Aethina tumida]|uniref:N-acetylgalactosamine kinase n=1 Tax=Aethina tumida TaxID=116153 RepID=UPI002148C552|nr:N-acetylgalactosamine kinase [Aethina tumida]
MSKDSSAVPVLQLPVTDRSRQLADVFTTRFKCNPQFFVRVPGRVNLIGEHIDYCGYGVCPMALEQDILLAVSCEEGDDIHLHNVEDTYPDHVGSIRNVEIKIGEGAPQWHQYFFCGVRGILDILPEGTNLRSMKIAVSGRVPQRAGLSSSSALVSAAALATAYAHELELAKDKIASVCAECERYIGTQGGGMDQAIAFLATEGCAKFIEFSPLRSTDVALPAGAVFVISHSKTNLNKAATSHFNCRVVECRLAAQIIAKKQGLEWTSVKRLGELQTRLNVDLPSMISLVERTLHEEPYSKAEVVAELDTTSARLDEVSLTANTRNIESFKLRQRALHVFKEALRVEMFHQTCKNAEEGALQILGRLMTESHESLRDLYECSHPQLDRLVELSLDLSLGSRLTGAGWGGCVVSLVRPENVDAFKNSLKEKFYAPLGITCEKELESALFATAPNSGASILVA